METDMYQLVGWIGLSILVGFFWSWRKKSFVSGVIWSLVLSPLLGFIIGLVWSIVHPTKEMGEVIDAAPPIGQEDQSPQDRL